MSQRPKQQNQHIRSQTFKVSSLTEECLNNLRKGTSSPKTHLLGFMSEYIQDEEEIKLQEVDELCCYDRMKKLLIKNDDTKEERKEQEATLFKAMQIEAKMNQLERDLQQRVSNKSQLGHNTIGNRTKTDPKSRTQHYSFKNSMLDNLKEKGYEKFFQFQKIKKQTNISKIKSIIGEEVESKFKKVINEKDLDKRKLMDENKILQRKILQKNVELETLRSENLYLKEYVKQMEEKLFGANNELQNAHLIASYEKWLSQYKEFFGEMSIKQLNNYIDGIKTKCLEKFDRVENKNQLRLIQMTEQNEDKCLKLKKEMEKLERRENELIEVNRNLKLNRQISELQINELQRAKSQLVTLRELILSLYSQWYEKRTDNEKSLLRNFNKLKENYSYEDMLQYIVFHDSKLSTNDKLNDYILKILRGIQKIRRIIFPLQNNEKLDPFVVLERIETWVDKRVQEKEKQKEKGTKVGADFGSTNAQRHAKSKAILKEKLEEGKYFQES